MTSCKACILESLWPYLPLVGASELRHRQLGSRVLGADYDDHDEDRRSWWGPMIMKRTKDHDEDQRSRWGPMILTRTDDHDEDQRSRWGPMIMTRTDDHDEDRWSWQGPMIMTRTWSSPDHDEGSSTLGDARRNLERDELANVPVPLVDAAPEKNKKGNIKTL